MEYQNQHPPVIQDSSPEPEKKKGLKALLFGLLVIAIGAVGYMSYTNPQLFRAEVLEVGKSTNLPATVKLFIPNYTADAKDSGSIAIKADKNLAVSEDLVSLKFKLKYNPVNALKFNANSIVFETGKTLFQSADLKAVNTATPGEVIVSLFSNTPVTIKAADPNEQTLFRLAVDIDGAPGSKIDLKVEDVEVINKNPATGVFGASTEFSLIGAEKIELNQVSSKNQLKALNAEALSDTQILIRFSDLLYPGTFLGNTTTDLGQLSDYSLVDQSNNPLAVSKVESGFGHSLCVTCDQSTVILTTASQKPGDIYVISIDPNATIISNTQGQLDPKFTRVGFTGYQNPGPNTSTVQLSSIDVNSATELVLHFSGELNTATFTPVNVILFSGIGNNLANGNLVLTKIDEIDKKTYRLTTVQQKPSENYFIMINGLKDATGKPLVNNRVLNFFGFTSPKMAISQVKPNVVINDKDQTVELLGTNLDIVTEVRLGSTNINITQSATKPGDSIKITVPTAFAVGAYDITLVNKFQETKTLVNGLVVSATAQPFRVVSTDSRAVPAKVSPDGKTPVTLYALVEDPLDIASVNSVTIDLGAIGGLRAQAMTKDPGLQKKGQQFYTYTTTIDPKTPTQLAPYELEVQARKGSETVNGMVTLTVTNDVLQSVAPVVDQISVNPVTVSPDGKTPVKISAKITDKDGADTISSVIADLTPIGSGFVSLKPLLAGNASEQSTAFYESDEFKVPTSTKEGQYKITVTASDATGETAKSEITLEVSSSITGPVIDGTKTYLSPRKSVPNDGKTSFSVNAMVSDSDGVGDIDSVVAYFTSLGLKPVTLVKDPKATDSAKAAFYSSESLVIPSTAPFGVHDVQIIASDKTGGKGQFNLKIDVTYEDTIGDAPIVFGKKSYATPKVAVNDGKTPVTLYAFVRDDDQDLESVIVNLKGIGQVGPEVAAEFGTGAPVPSVGSGGCPTGSNVIVCMKPSFTEGRDGQWFVLSDVTISRQTAPSNQPYMIDVIATDAGRKVGRGQIPIVIRDSQNFVLDKQAPEIVGAVPVSSGKIEVVFNEPILASTVSSIGKEFTITQKSDISQVLKITGAAMNADGNIVTLTTDKQLPGEAYLLTAKDVQDISGISIAGQGSSDTFSGFQDSLKSPVIHLVSAADQETVEIEFQEPIRPSSVALGSSTTGRGNFDIKISESDDVNQELPIKSVALLEGGKVLQIKTQVMKSGQRYQLQIENISSASGNSLKNKISKFFKAINYRAVQQSNVANQADLNGDGKVDFIDFTLFSASYGKIFSNGGSAPSGTNNTSSGSSSQGLQPITANPNATVPITTNAQ